MRRSGRPVKNECYQRQTSYALERQNNDFAKAFDLCAKIEDDFRPACYQGLGWDASVQSLNQSADNMIVNESTSRLCMLGENYEVRFNCVVGAVQYFIRHYYGDAQAKTLCQSFDANLRAACLKETGEYYRSLQTWL